ncbi:MAG: alpha/beta hydrolase [Pseudomonadota bacterium]
MINHVAYGTRLRISAVRLASVVLAAVLPMIGGAGAAAQTTKLSETRIQKGLIAAGVLDKPVGAAKSHELSQALVRYRQIYTGGTATDTEPDEIAAFADALKRDFGLVEVKDRVGRVILVPRKLTARTDEPDATQSFYRSRFSEAQFYTFRWKLQRNPPSEMLRAILLKARDANILSVAQSNRAFTVHLRDHRVSSRTGKKTPRFQYKTAFTAGGYLTGLYVTYLDRPSRDFEVPSFLAPLIRHWTVPDTVLAPLTAAERTEALNGWMDGRFLSSDQRRELADLITQSDSQPTMGAVTTLVRLWVWRKSLSMLSHWISAAFEETNRWASVPIETCVNSRGVMQKHRDVRVVVATNRQLTPELKAGNKDATTWFTTNVSAGNAMHIVCASISVPNDTTTHTSLETRFRKDWIGNTTVLGADDTKLFRVRSSKLLRSVPATASAHRLRLLDRERWLFPSESRALVFVHGYNTSFQYALMRIAQLAATIEYPGRVYLFSWPSAEEMQKYMADMDSAERSEVHLAGFLRAIFRDPTLRKLDIIAHSMGSQLIVRALGDLRDVFYARDDIRIGEIILAAPDVATEVFAEKVREVSYLADGITVYGSAKDKALRASQSLRGTSPRLGQLTRGADVPLPKVRMIDATSPSNICNGWGYVQIEHNYFGDNPVLLQHIESVLERGLRKTAKADKVEKSVIEKIGDNHFRLKLPDPNCWFHRTAAE